MLMCIVVHGRDDVEHEMSTITLRPVDYYQMLTHKVATFEAEYQYIVREIKNVGSVHVIRKLLL